MLAYSEKLKDIEKISAFNKLMIDTVKVKEDEFKFEGNQYMVYSDGVCVQTLIKDRFLYRISIKDHKDNCLVSSKLLNYI